MPGCRMRRPFRRYVAVLMILAALYFVPVTTINLAVDPCAQFRAISLDRVDGHRLYGSRIAKAALIRQNPIDVAILGSSRPLAALDPEHDAFAGMNAYNLALPGTNIFEQWDLFSYLMQHQAPNHIILCLDYAFFDGERGGFDDFDKSMLNPKQSLTECWAESLFSVYALKKSRGVLEAYRAGGPRAIRRSDCASRRVPRPGGSAQGWCYRPRPVSHISSRRQTRTHPNGSESCATWWTSRRSGEAK